MKLITLFFILITFCIHSYSQSDYHHYYEYVCNDPINLSIDTVETTDSFCGNLYDSGGATADYGNKESFRFEIRKTRAYRGIYTRVILHDLNLADCEELLVIGNKIYGCNPSLPDTLYFDSNRTIRVTFKSNGSGTADGFHISWDRLMYQGDSTFISPQFGFFYHPQQRSIGGGIEQDRAWSKIGVQSIALGYGSKAEGNNSTSIGTYNTVCGHNGVAIGNDNHVSSSSSYTFGRGLVTGLNPVTVLGAYNAPPINEEGNNYSLNPTFIIGNGYADSNRSTALTILKNGNTGIGISTPSEVLEVEGNIKASNKLMLGSVEAFRDGGRSKIAANSHLVGASENRPNGTGYDLGSIFIPWEDLYLKEGVVNISDRQAKTNIKKLDAGLEEILRLQPIKYQWKNSKTDKEKIGLIAQDLLNVLPEVVKTQDWVIPEDTAQEPYRIKLERLGIYYTDIIPVLINAIQEEHALNEAKTDRIQNLEQQVDDLVSRLAIIEQQILNKTEGVLPKKATLFQNRPNPFSDYTYIPYYIPKDVKKAYIQITNMQGRIIQKIELTQFGNGNILLSNNTFSGTTYFSSLIVDGRIIDTKQMLIHSQ